MPQMAARNRYLFRFMHTYSLGFITREPDSSPIQDTNSSWLNNPVALVAPRLCLDDAYIRA